MELIRLFMGILLIICLILSINYKKLNSIIENLHPAINNEEPLTLLGIYVQDFKGRVRVADVLDYTPARAAGIETGDRIIEVEGKKVKDVKSFIENIENAHDKDKINLVIHRVDSRSTFPVEVVPLGF